MATFATAALLASAQGVKDLPFLQKGVSKPESDATTKLMKAPLNTEKPKGPLMFGSVMDDYNILRHYATFYANEPGKLNKLNKVCDPDPDNWNYEQLFGLRAGCYGGDGYYYGYRLKLYSLGITYANDFVKVNPLTGEFTSVYKFDDGYQSQSSWPVLIYDMAYNPADGEMYAIAADPEAEDVAMSLIGTVDKKTGEFKKLCSLNRYYFAIAFDYDGTLYGITWTYRAQGNGTSQISGTRLDQFDDEFEYKKGTTILVNETAYLPYYAHSLDFDYTTGDLYWGACDTDYNQTLVKVDPDTGKTESLGKFGNSEIVNGLYIPFITADSRTAPARVNGLTYAFDPQGANKTTLTWTNPTTQWNRKTLSNLVEVNIYRDDMKSAPVGTVDASGKVGQQMTWTDEKAERGLHKYYVVPSSVKGQAGIMDSISAFVGRDLPGSPENVKAVTPEGKTIVLTWEAPTRGDSDGWFDKESITYTVTREQDNKVIAKDLAALTVTDSDIPEATTYTYSIVAKNTEGEGLPTVSNGVLAGQTVAIPFYTNFPNSVEAGRFSVLDGNSDGSVFTYGFNTNNNKNSYKLDLSKTRQDDYLVSPPLGVKDGHSYRVTYTVSVGRYGIHSEAWTQDFRVVGGKTATLEGLNEEYADLPEFVFNSIYDRQKVTTEFTADHDGEHYVAFNILTDNDEDAWVYVEDFLIEEIMKNDLEATLLDVPGIISSTEDKNCPNVYKVTVSNPGSNSQSDYKVQVGFKSLSGNYIGIAETSAVPTLAHNESAVIVLNGTPDDVEDGDYKLVARVVLDGDEADDNNETAEVPVKVDGNPALNFKVEQGDLSWETNTPFSFYTAYSATQTIYSPDMLAMEIADDVDPKIQRMVWEYDADRNIDGTEITVYLGQTATKNVVAGSSEWIVTNQDKVYEGTVDIKKGSGWLDIVLDEKNVFEFDPDMSLVVTVVKSNPKEGGDWPVRFRVFDYEQRHPDYYHTMGYRGGNPFSLSNYSSFTTYAYPQAPVLYLSVPGAGITGVEAIAGGENAEISYENGYLDFNGIDVREASVWSVDGKLVRKGAVAGGQVSLDVLPGIYVVKATAADGTVYTAKVNVSL